MASYTLIHLDLTLSAKTPRRLLAAMARALQMPSSDPVDPMLDDLFGRALFSGRSALEAQWPDVLATFESSEFFGLLVSTPSGTWRLVTLSAAANARGLVYEVAGVIGPWIEAPPDGVIGEVWTESDIGQPRDANRSRLIWSEAGLCLEPMCRPLPDREDDLF